jgi:hypothetical protein
MAWILAFAVATAFAAEPPPLTKARGLYNAGDYQGAIDAAAMARSLPQWADAAALVMARAYIERHRQNEGAEDLAAAREAIGAVRPAALTPRDQVDLFVGLGQLLYAAGTFGAAAELFDTALGRTVTMSASDRESLLEWWAAALDQDAQSRPPDRRAALFERLAKRMEQEIAREPSNQAPNYWLAAAARGAGDPERAWHAAVAGWIRSSLAPVPPTVVHFDLDKLVLEVIIPERARTRPPREQQAAMAALRAEWDQIKQQWK